MIYPRFVDIDRLHRICDAISTHQLISIRGQGASTSYIALMLGELQLGAPYNTYIYIGATHDMCQNVCTDLRNILVSQGYYCSVNPNLDNLYVEDKHLMLYSLNRFITDSSIFKGQRYQRMFFDIDEHMMARYNPSQIYSAWNNALLSLDINGDIL